MVVRLEAVRKVLAGRYMDVVIVVVAVATTTELLTDGRPVPALVSAVFGLVLLARRRAPTIAIVASFAGQLALAALLGWHEPTGPFGLFLLTFVVAGGLRPEWAAWVGWACGMAAAAVAEAPGSGGSVSDILLTCGFCSALFVMSLVVTRRTKAHKQMAERARQAEVDRESSAAEAAAAERARIAREMHDVVAHSLTVAVVQCVAVVDDLDSGAAEGDAVRVREPRPLTAGFPAAWAGLKTVASGGIAGQTWIPVGTYARLAARVQWRNARRTRTAPLAAGRPRRHAL